MSKRKRSEGANNDEGFDSPSKRYDPGEPDTAGGDAVEGQARGGGGNAGGGGGGNDPAQIINSRNRSKRIHGKATMGGKFRFKHLLHNVNEDSRRAGLRRWFNIPWEYPLMAIGAEDMLAKYMEFRYFRFRNVKLFIKNPICHSKSVANGNITNQDSPYAKIYAKLDSTYDMGIPGNITDWRNILPDTEGFERNEMLEWMTSLDQEAFD